MKGSNENSKMFLYKKLKLNLEREFYLSCNNSDIRRGFTKIRIRDHNLEIKKDNIAKYLEYSDFVKPVIKLRMKSTLYWNVL